MPLFNLFRKNQQLIEKIKEVRLDNPELDVKPIKLAPSIQSTYWPESYRTKQLEINFNGSLPTG